MNLNNTDKLIETIENTSSNCFGSYCKDVLGCWGDYILDKCSSVVEIENNISYGSNKREQDIINIIKEQSVDFNTEQFIRELDCKAIDCREIIENIKGKDFKVVKLEDIISIIRKRVENE